MDKSRQYSWWSRCVVKIDHHSWMHSITPKQPHDWQKSLVSKIQIYNIEHGCKNVVKYVLNYLKYSIVRGSHLVVEFSNGNVAYDPQKVLIQIVQFEFMKEVIYWVPKSICMKKNMGDSHDVLLVGHSLGRETKAQPKILQPCKHIKKYKG